MHSLSSAHNLHHQLPTNPQVFTRAQLPPYPQSSIQQRHELASAAHHLQQQLQQQQQQQQQQMNWSPDSSEGADSGFEEDPAVAQAALHQELLTEYGRFVPAECVFDYLADIANATIDCSQTPTNSMQKQLPPLSSFIGDLFLRSRLSPLVLLCAGVYLRRLQQKLPAGSKGLYCTCHRTLLACIVVASKNLYDSCPKNKHWARSSGFSIVEINLMERQLLALLDYNITVSPAEMYNVLAQHLHSYPQLPPSPSYEQALKSAASTTTVRCQCLTRPHPTEARRMQQRRGSNASTISTIDTTMVHVSTHTEVPALPTVPVPPVPAVAAMSQQYTLHSRVTATATTTTTTTTTNTSAPSKPQPIAKASLMGSTGNFAATSLRDTIKSSATWSPARMQKYSTMAPAAAAPAPATLHRSSGASVKPPTLTRTCSASANVSTATSQDFLRSIY
ncbi:PHO85 cyclin-1 [Sorochytrium milnesiophthora]